MELVPTPSGLLRGSVGLRDGAISLEPGQGGSNVDFGFKKRLRRKGPSPLGEMKRGAPRVPCATDIRASV